MQAVHTQTRRRQMSDHGLPSVHLHNVQLDLNKNEKYHLTTLKLKWVGSIDKIAKCQLA